MKRFLFLTVFCGFLALLCAENAITVYKDGSEFFVKSRFSETEDLIIQNWRYANERAYLVKRGTPIQNYKQGIILHASSDDYPASTPLGAYGILSGNHGSAYARLLHIPGHGLTVKDLGGVIKEKNGTTYIIMQITGKDHILIHPEGRNNTVSHGFVRHTKAQLFYKGKELPFKSSTMQQLYPMNRITSWQLLADGVTPVPEKKEIKCRFLDFIFVHDVLDPYHVVQSVKNAPGRKPLPEWSGSHNMLFVNSSALKKRYASFMKLPALATFSNRMRFEAGNVNVNYRKAVYHVPLSVVRNLDIMFMWNGSIANQKRQKFYIPKVKPIVLTERGTKKKITIDFSTAPDLPRKLDVSYVISKKDLAVQTDMPDRYIRISGNEKFRYGIALGYSLFMGHTAKGKFPGERPSLYHLYRTHKMYPHSYMLYNVKPGRTVETVAYRQYFDPQREPDATNFYWHHQGKSLVVYLDFHKELKNKIVKLPEEAAGKKITVLEKTPALTLHTGDTVPATGIKLDNAAKHGYLVLKLD